LLRRWRRIAAAGSAASKTTSYSATKTTEYSGTGTETAEHSVAYTTKDADSASKASDAHSAQSARYARLA